MLTLVATTSIMSVQDRLKEYAVLETLGVRPLRVFRLVVSESILLCLAGGVLGTAFALTMLGWGGMAIGAEGVTIAFRPSIQLALWGTSISLIVGLLAGLAPATQAARTPILNSLQEG